MCLSACPHQRVGTRWAGDRHAEQEADASVLARASSSATQPCRILCTCWMGFPQVQEPANWGLSKVTSISWEKISLSSAASGGTLWAQKALLTRREGYTACVRVMDMH